MLGLCRLSSSSLAEPSRRATMASCLTGAFKYLETGEHLLWWHPNDRKRHPVWNENGKMGNSYIGATIRRRGNARRTPRRQRGSGFRWCAGLGPNDACGRDTLDGLVLRSTFALGLYTTEKGHRCQTRSGLLMRNCHSEFSYLAKLLPSFYFGVITSPRPADNW